MQYAKPKKNYIEILEENRKLQTDSELWAKVNNSLTQQLAKQAKQLIQKDRDIALITDGVKTLEAYGLEKKAELAKQAEQIREAERLLFLCDDARYKMVALHTLRKDIRIYKAKYKGKE